MFTFRTDNQKSRFIWLLVAGIFMADLLLPRQFDIVFAYLLAHFLAIFFKEKSDVLLLAVVTTTLTIIGAVVKPHEVPLEQMLLERLPPMLSFWAAAFFVVRFITLREFEEQQEEKFKALFQYATNGILLTNKQGIIVMANPAIEVLFGYQEDGLLGKSVEVLIPTRLTRQHTEHREHYHQNPHPRSMGIGMDLKGLKKDGSEFPVEVSLSPFKSKDGAYVVAFVVDNTYRKKHEDSILQQKQELASLTEALQELNEGLESKVEARTAELELAKNELALALNKERELGELKSRFVSMASHEFRTPLTSVMSSAGLAIQYADRQDFEKVKKHANRIKNAVNGLNSILSEFLSLGRLEEGRVAVNAEEVNILDCVAEVHEGLKNLFKPGQTFEHRHAGTEKISMDCNLGKNILINLISNAIKYSPEGAPILVETTVGEKTVRISVRDRGIGIPDAEQKHLFGRFFRASNAANTTQGTGLGLYIVQRYAEMMNGVVGFNSEIEEGSVFWVEFAKINAE
ncbi:MAG: PAS domain-containing sensor histidine kinase [Saprospiraceae bacterium]|nr:PAS domain-containing sensor histidine kinase [Saprospiraceae bacterium]